MYSKKTKLIHECFWIDSANSVLRLKMLWRNKKVGNGHNSRGRQWATASFNGSKQSSLGYRRLSHRPTFRAPLL